MSKYKLKDVCEFITDGTHQTPVYCESGGYIFLSSKDVTSHKIDWDNAKRIPLSLHEKLYSRLSPRKNDILLAKNGTTGVAAIVDRDEIFDVYVSLAVLRPKPEILPQYLLFAVNSPVCKRQFNAGLKGVGVPNLHLSVIRETEISVPEFKIQIDRCNKLQYIIRIIEERNNQLTKLDDLVKARFVEMFGDLKINPYNYEKKPLKGTCAVVTGNTPSRSVPKYYGDSVEWIKTDNIVAGQLYPSKAIEYLSDEGMKAGRTVEKGAILMACIAGSVASIGRVCITNRKVAFNQQINAIIPKEYNSLFLYVMLQLSKEYLVEEINMALKGILSKSKLEDKVFIVPPMDTQKEFAAFVTQVYKSKVVVQKALDEAQLLFDSLMQQYFG